MDDYWNRLLENTKIWDKDVLYPIFKQLHDNGAELRVKTAIFKGRTMPMSLKLLPGKYDKDEWDSKIKPEVLMPHKDEIKMLFAATLIGRCLQLRLAKDIPKERVIETTFVYGEEMLNSMQHEEFALQVGDKVLYIVPERTGKNRTEITGAEAYVLKYMTDIYQIESMKDLYSYINWV